MARQTHDLSLSGILAGLRPETWAQDGTALALVGAALLAVLLAENARIPVDDPNTHLELTMIHEVMVLDHGGPDFGLIQYAAALKLWILGACLAGLTVPVRTGRFWIDTGAALLGMLALTAIVGAIESVLARLRLLRVPHLLAGAGALSTLAFLLILR